jgi:hypothetical protein
MNDQIRKLPNGLTRQSTDCLIKSGIPIDKAVIIEALVNGILFPRQNPPGLFAKKGWL